MALVKKSITVTDQQADWIKSRVVSGHYGNESEVVRELIRERQLREQEGADEIEAIRAALIEGENSGVGSRSLDELWRDARLNRNT
ncbi:MAG: type II toxin-antitoxin system ParD family antitoxin [Alphaproteobacteria bacterium]|jgi:antitoxin ParD1/3/4